MLEALRRAWQSDPPADDLPDHSSVTPVTGEDGEVVRVRFLRWDEVLAVLERDCGGDVT